MEDFIQRSIIAACIGMCGEGGKWKERYKRRAVVIIGRRNDKKKKNLHTLEAQGNIEKFKNRGNVERNHETRFSPFLFSIGSTFVHTQLLPDVHCQIRNNGKDAIYRGNKNRQKFFHTVPFLFHPIIT